MQRIVFACAWLVVVAGCSRPSTPAPESDKSPVLATVGGRAITQADFDDYLARRLDHPIPLDPQTVLRELVEREAMLIKAEKSGVGDTADFRRESENRLISAWLAGTLNREREAARVTDDELKAAYEQRKNDVFRQGAQNRYAILYRKGANADELKTILAEAVSEFAADREKRTQKGRLTGFGTMAADRSEDTVSRYRGGDVGWFDAENPESARVPQEVLAAGAKLAPGQISQPMAAGDGVYVIMKSDVRDAKQIAFQEAAPALRRKIMTEKRAAIEAAFKTGLVANVRVEFKEAPLIHPKPPAKPSELPALPNGPQS